jgi:hypothetical protein
MCVATMSRLSAPAHSHIQVAYCLCIASCSLRTTLCVRFKSEVVASGAIFYAARRLQVSSLDRLSSYCVPICYKRAVFY